MNAMHLSPYTPAKPMNDSVSRSPAMLFTG